MKDFFLKVWAQNMGAHYTLECIVHSKIWQLLTKKNQLDWHLIIQQKHFRPERSDMKYSR